MHSLIDLWETLRLTPVTELRKKQVQRMKEKERK